MPAKYDILRTLEEDSASMLYLAQDKKRGAECWLRRFRTRKEDEISGLQELFTQISTVGSSHLVPVLDFGTDKEGFYTVTPVQEGETLEQLLQRGPLTTEEFEVLAGQLLELLDDLHELAIVHGAIRPDHVRITGASRKEWNITLGGFGQGFAVKGEAKEAQIRAYRCTAPEQWLDGTTRRRTDVYALGCVFYEALAARAPFESRALKELRLKHLGHDVAPLQKLASHAPAWMCAWVMHLLSADPEQRPRKAGVAREQFEKREAPPAPPPGPPPDATPPTAAMVAIQPAAGMSFPAATVPPPTPAPLAAAPPISAPVPVPASSAAALAQPLSAPVVLPASHTLVRNVTSRTIPISAAPRSPAPGMARPGPAPQRPSAKSAPQPRKPTAQPPRTNSAAPAKKSLAPYLIIGGAVALLLGVFGLSRCSGNKPPAAKPGASASKKT